MCELDWCCYQSYTTPLSVFPPVSGLNIFWTGSELCVDLLKCKSATVSNNSVRHQAINVNLKSTIQKLKYWNRNPPAGSCWWPAFPKDRPFWTRSLSRPTAPSNCFENKIYYIKRSHPKVFTQWKLDWKFNKIKLWVHQYTL